MKLNKSDSMKLKGAIPQIPKRYCGKCGKLMITYGEMKVKRDDGIWGSYDSRTGKIPILAKQEIRCPDFKLWNGHAISDLEYYSERAEGWQ